MTRRARLAILRFIRRHNITWDYWRKLALFVARASLDSAPPHIRVLLVGRPFQLPANVCELAEIFAFLYFNTQDRAISSNTCFFVAEVWMEAITLWEDPRG